MIQKLGWIAVLAGLNGCLSEVPEEHVGANQLVASEFEFYAMQTGGSGLRLTMFYTVRNPGNAAIYLDQVCTTVLQQRSGAAWVTVQTPTCPADPITLDVLQPGASQRVQYSISGISGNSLPALHRLRVALYGGVAAAGGGQVGTDPLPLNDRFSNEFTLNRP